MTRNVIDKFLRLTEVRQQYIDKIESLAERQLQINAKVVKEYKLQDHYEYRDVIYYDYVKVDDNGRIELWQSSFRSNPAEYMSTTDLSDLIIANNVEEYERQLRAELKPKAELALQSKQRQAEDKRKQLETELARLNNELHSLGS